MVASQLPNIPNLTPRIRCRSYFKHETNATKSIRTVYDTPRRVTVPHPWLIPRTPTRGIVSLVKELQQRVTSFLDGMLTSSSLCRFHGILPMNFHSIGHRWNPLSTWLSPRICLLHETLETNLPLQMLTGSSRHRRNFKNRPTDAIKFLDRKSTRLNSSH